MPYFPKTETKTDGGFDMGGLTPDFGEAKNYWQPKAKCSVCGQFVCREDVRSGKVKSDYERNYGHDRYEWWHVDCEDALRKKIAAR